MFLTDTCHATVDPEEKGGGGASRTDALDGHRFPMFPEPGACI